MGLKVVHSLAKTAVKSAPYLTPKVEISALKSLSLKMEQLTGDVIQIGRKAEGQAINQKHQEFLNNWNFVLKKIDMAEYKPVMSEGLKKELYDKLSPENKVLASYITEDFSDAVNSYLRLGAENNPYYSWWANKGLDCESVPKYRDALKYAMDGLKSHIGTTFRWQPAGSFIEDFKVYQLEAKSPMSVLPRKANGVFAKLELLNDNIGVSKDNPLYMSLKRSRCINRKVMPQEGDIIEVPTFVSSGQNLFGLEEFRRRIYYDSGCKHPELILIKGKNGKIIPPELCGLRAYEKEVLYKADTRYRYIGEKNITSPDELEGFDKIIESNIKNNCFGFQPFKAIALEEI